MGAPGLALGAFFDGGQIRPPGQLSRSMAAGATASLILVVGIGATTSADDTDLFAASFLGR